jgi:hypothetical protein
MDRSINCGSAGCSRLNAQVLKERRTVSAVTWFFFFEWLCDPFLADRTGCRKAVSRHKVGRLPERLTATSSSPHS